MAHTSVIETLMAARDNARDAEIQKQEDAERAQMMEGKIDISFDDQHPTNKERKQIRSDIELRDKFIKFMTPEVSDIPPPWR